MKISACIVALVLALGLTGTAQAAEQPPGPEAFYGRYQGTGLAQDPSAMAFGFDKRDFDVEIGASSGGFFVAWTTVMQSPAGKAIKGKTSRISSTNPNGGLTTSRPAAVIAGPLPSRSGAVPAPISSCTLTNDRIPPFSSSAALASTSGSAFAGYHSR